MALQLDCYLSFDGNCEEALTFYAQALGGKATFMRFDSAPKDSGMTVPAGWGNKVMHGTVEAGGAQIMGSDVPPEMGGAGEYKGFTVSFWAKDGLDQARKVFDALANGGKVTMPLDQPFWGGWFGMVQDRFGVPWMVSCE